MRAWWPNINVPPGTGVWPQRPSDDAGDSGSISTVADTAVTNARLCAKTFAKQTPVVLEVVVQVAGLLNANNVSSAFDLFALVRNAASMGAGYLLVEYGSGSAYEQCKLDLRGGSYQLPPCEEVRVSVTTVVSGGDLPPLSISGALTPGVHPSPTAPTYTWRDEALATAGVTVYVPARARSVDVWLANTSGALKYGSGAPILSLWGDTAQAQLVRDYTTGIWAPPFPAQLTSAGGFDGDYTHRVQVFTTVICEAVVQFGLEL